MNDGALFIVEIMKNTYLIMWKGEKIMNKNFDYNIAIKNEEYAKYIQISTQSDYDDFIFVLSAFYASGVELNKIINAIEKDNNLWYDNVRDASIVHCLPWKEAVKDIMEYLNINEIKEIKPMRESREWVKNNMTPYLLKHFKENNEILVSDILTALKNAS